MSENNANALDAQVHFELTPEEFTKRVGLASYTEVPLLSFNFVNCVSPTIFLNGSAEEIGLDASGLTDFLKKA